MKRFKSFTVLVLGLLPVILWCNLPAKDTPAGGTIKGHIIDFATKEPLAGVNIEVLEKKLGAASDAEGSYFIEHVPVGHYRLRISYIGYQTVTMTDIIVRPDRASYYDTELRESLIESDAISVSAGYFSNTADQPVSVTNFSAEEIRRAPGSAGDVSRIIYGLPSVAKVNDTKNSLIVRGGSSLENSFYVDNVEINNINHFPEQGSSGGPIGMLNVDLIKDVNFYTGGFSAEYGDRMSSVMALEFREGDRDRFRGQLDLGLAGFGGVAEGPALDGKGSWLLAARRSYLDLIVGAIGETNSAVPQYSDVQFKAVYDPTPKHHLTVLGIMGWDAIGLTADEAVQQEEAMYNNFRLFQSTFGVNWRYLRSQTGYSNTSFSHSMVKYNFGLKETRSYSETGTEKTIMTQTSGEQEYRLRNVNHYNLDRALKFDFGVEFKYLVSDFDNYYGPYYDYLGNPTPPLSVAGKSDAFKLDGFSGLIWTPLSGLTLTPGIRISYFTYNKQTNLAPRLSASYEILDNTTVNFSSGLFYQNLPLVLLAQNDANSRLKTPHATHFVFGISHLLTENTQLTIEAYQKEYENLPVDPSQPDQFLMDEIYNTGVFLMHGALQDGGKADARGIEIMVQKKLAESVYGMASVSYFRSRYQDQHGNYKDRVYDNRLTFNIEGGYKPNKQWEFSMRWIYAGGAPYTPLNEEASAQANRAVYDQTLINAKRLPAYHSLNLRADRRFFFNRSNIVLYLSIWNVYGRENISGYSWNGYTNEKSPIRQWSTLPILGVEYEF
jgi:outer membrane receptor for ferrienterochelin and colicin